MSSAGATRSSPPPERENAALRGARVLVYLGLATVGESVFRPAIGLTISELLFMAALSLAVFATLSSATAVPLPWAIVVSVGLFAFGGGISSTAAQSPVGSAYQLAHAVYVLLLWPWVCLMVLRTRRQIITAILLWSVSAALDGVGASLQLAGIHVLGTAPEVGRMRGFTIHPNDLGGVTGIALVPALMIASLNYGRPMPGKRILLWVCVTLVAAGLVLSGSLSGMAAAATALTVWLVAPAVRTSARVAVVGALVCGLAIVALAGNKITSPSQRLQQVTSSDTQASSGSGQTRIQVAGTAWPRIKSDPFVGTGLDAADSSVTIVSHGVTVPYQIHGLPIAAWYESGLFGLAGLMFLLVTLFWIGWKSVKEAHGEGDALIGWTLLCALLAFVIEAMAQPMVFQQYSWITAVLIVAWVCRRDRVASPSAAPQRVDLDRPQTPALAPAPLVSG